MVHLKSKLATNLFSDPLAWAVGSFGRAANYRSLQLVSVTAGALVGFIIYLLCSAANFDLSLALILVVLSILFATFIPLCYLRGARALALAFATPQGKEARCSSCRAFYWPASGRGCWRCEGPQKPAA